MVALWRGEMVAMTSLVMAFRVVLVVMSSDGRRW